MNNLTIILIAISLSMDAFSLALSTGMTYNNKQDYIVLSIIVGLFHFIMPFLGYNLANILLKTIIINSNRLLFIIFVFLGIEMFLDIIKKDKTRYDITLSSKLLFAFSVSLDSFTIGLGITKITSMPYLTYIIFMLTSALFTYLGLIIGSYSYKKLGIKAKIIGLIIIIYLAIKSIL